jgi:acyl-CoA thioesterase-1
MVRSTRSDFARCTRPSPFFLEGIALSPDLMQADGIHPNESGQPKLLLNAWPQLMPLLQK